MVYPAVCAHCGAPATERIRIQKVFVRHRSDGPNETVIGEAWVPFCPACTDRHSREVRRITPLQRFLMCFREPTFVAAVGPACLLWVMTPGWFRFVLRGELIGAAGMGAFLVFIGSIGVWGARETWSLTRQYAVVEPTDVTKSFDFSDDRSEVFDATRHLYILQNPDFAAAFRTLNESQVWNPQSRTARVASRKRRVLYIVFGVVVGVVVLWQMVHDFFR